MHSNDNPPDDNASDEVGVEPTPPRPLRREAMLIATERQRGALLAAVCSLAGVGLGFGLSQMAIANTNCHRHTVAVEQVRSQSPVQAKVSPTVPRIAKFTWLGVEGHTLRLDDARSGIGIGAVVTGVFPGSPAAEAGLAPGSIITGVEGTPVVSFPALIAAIRSHDKGEQVTVAYVSASRAESVAYRGSRADLYRSTNQAEVILGDISKSQFFELESTWRRR